MNGSRLSASLVLGGLIFFSADCSGSEAIVGSSSTASGGHPVVVLNPASMALQANAAEQAQGTYTFRVTGTAPALDSGTVVIGAENGGYLRMIRSTSRDGAMLTAQTDPAALTDAVRDGELHVSTATAIGGSSERSNSSNSSVRWGALTSQSLEPGVVIHNGRIDLNDVVLIGSAASGLSIVDGSVTFTPDVALDVSIGLWKVKEFKAQVSGTMTFDADLRLGIDGADSVFPDARPIAVVNRPFVAQIGPFPVYGRVIITTSLVPKLAVEGQATVQTGITTSATVSVGAQYQNGQWRSLTGPTASVMVKPLTVTIGGKVIASVGVKIESQVLLYETVSPYLWVEPYLQANASVDLIHSSWQMSCTSAINAGVGISVKIFDYVLADFSTDDDYLKTLWPVCDRSGTLLALGSMTIASGNNQSAGAGTQLASPLVVRLSTPLGAPAVGVPVTFASSGGGSFRPASAVTNSQGVAQTLWTVGAVPGPQTATAAATGYIGSPATFSATSANTSACHPIPYTIGTTVSGVLTSGACQFFNTHTYYDDYSTVLSSPQTLQLSMSGSFSPNFAVNLEPSGFVNNGFYAATGKTSVSEKAILPAGSTYFRPAAGAIGVTGTYSFSVAPASSADVTGCENVLLASAVTTAQQLSVGDCDESGTHADRYSIAIPAGWTVVVTMRSTAFDAYLELHNQGDSYLTGDDDSGGGHDAQIRFTNTSGNFLGYYIHAKSYRTGATGAYTLQYTLSAPASISQPGSRTPEAAPRPPRP